MSLDESTTTIIRARDGGNSLRIVLAGQPAPPEPVDAERLRTSARIWFILSYGRDPARVELFWRPYLPQVDG